MLNYALLARDCLRNTWIHGKSIQEFQFSDMFKT